MPPLRERVDDLAVICAAVLQRIARDAGVTPAPRLAPDALEHLSHYGFPGNVRELENLLYRAVTLAGAEVIERDDLGLGDEVFVDSEWQALEPAVSRSGGSSVGAAVADAGGSAAPKSPGSSAGRDLERNRRHPQRSQYHFWHTKIIKVPLLC